MNPALDMQRERALAIARELAARAPEGAIATIFAGGSLGRGEVWSADVDGRTEVYSDVDLYVVARAPSDVIGIRSVAASLKAGEVSPSSARFLRAPDVGVYTRPDLEAQPLRPGTADLAVNHLMLYGDNAIPRGLRGREASKIPTEEALYLLENRALELSGEPAPAERAHARLALAQTLKARLDVYTAHAIVAGTFTPSLAERARRFRESPPDRLSGIAREEVAGAFDAVRDLTAWVQSRDAVTERNTALAALAFAWRTLAPRVLQVDAAPGSLVATRCREGAWAANARDVLRLRSRCATPLRRAAIAVPALTRFAPVAALRLDALARIYAREPADERKLASHFTYVDRLTRTFGFTDGPLEMRVHAMHRALS